MEISITNFVNPFSFFCNTGDAEKVSLENIGTAMPYKLNFMNGLSKIVHGQYVAVMWKQKWVRGIVSMETQCLIWLVDYGIYLHPDDKTVLTDLSPDFKKIPTKIFEASIHGVVPVDKTITLDCRIEYQACLTWSQGTSTRAKKLLDDALGTFFVPVALYSNNMNDVVLGDLYLNLPEKGITNIVHELELWPACLQQNKEDYVKNLCHLYNTRRRHRASTLKPDIPNLPTLTPESTLEQYDAACASALQIQFSTESDSDPDDASTVVGVENNKKEKKSFALTPDEIEEYSQMYVDVSGRDCNVLDILVNKMNDLKMCQRYKDHDLKGVGRGYHRTRQLQ